MILDVVKTSSHFHAPIIQELVAEKRLQEQSRALMLVVADVVPLVAVVEVLAFRKRSRRAKQDKLRARSSFKKSFFFMRAEMAPLKSSPMT